MESADNTDKRPSWTTLVNMPKITDERAELAAALSAAQSEIYSAPKTEKNPFFKSTYADLASVRAAIREAFGKHGLSIVQIPHTSNGDVLVTTILMHKSGQFIEGTLAIKPVKGDPQGVGSAITYARRYSLMAFAGVAPDDDDGNAASGKTEPPNNRQRTKDKPPKETNYWPTLKDLLMKIGVEEGDKDTADEVLQYCTKHLDAGMVNLSMAHREPECCKRAVEAIVEARRQFPDDCETPLLQVVKDLAAAGPKGH